MAYGVNSYIPHTHSGQIPDLHLACLRLCIDPSSGHTKGARARR